MSRARQTLEKIHVCPGCAEKFEFKVMLVQHCLHSGHRLPEPPKTPFPRKTLMAALMFGLLLVGNCVMGESVTHYVAWTSSQNNVLVYQ